MALPIGPYSGTSSLALVARASAFTFGLVYGSVKLKVLQNHHLTVKRGVGLVYHPVSELG
ncbi:hypothetical protein MKW92_039256 [Papaver armeniacum]|nr:hypothetical protein MKW92_039256 [Papaver armeniacum]